MGSHAAAVLKGPLGEKLGTVVIQAKHPWWFYKFHLRCLEAFADRMRTVVEHLESTLSADFLLQIGADLPASAHSRNLNHALKIVAQNFQKACDAQIVSLYLLEASFNRFLLYAEVGWKQAGWELSAYFAKHEGWMGSVALEDAPRYEKDLREYKQAIGNSSEEPYEYAMFGAPDATDDSLATESLALPLYVGGKHLGVLVAFRRYDREKKERGLSQRVKTCLSKGRIGLLVI
jgi:hypothetical protein